VPLADTLAKAVLAMTENSTTTARLGLLGFLGSRSLTIIMIVTALLSGAGVFCGWLWWTRSVPVVTQPPVLDLAGAESQDLLRKRTDQAFAPAIAEIVAGLKQLAMGNQGGARLREMCYDAKQPAAFFDWWFKHEQDGKVIFDKQFVVEVNYNANGDCVEAYFYADGINGPKKRLAPGTPIILFVFPEWGVKVPLLLPWFQRALTALEEVRTAFVIDKDRLDGAAKPVIQELESLLKQMVRGNEGTVLFEGIRYCHNRPIMKFRLRHRHVLSGQVVYSREQYIEFEYLADYHKVFVAWHQPDGHTTLWRYLTPESNYPIYPKNPVGDANPRIPAELLSRVPEILEPIVQFYHAPGSQPTSPPAIIIPQ